MEVNLKSLRKKGGTFMVLRRWEEDIARSSASGYSRPTIVIVDKESVVGRGPYPFSDSGFLIWASQVLALRERPKTCVDKPLDLLALQGVDGAVVPPLKPQPYMVYPRLLPAPSQWPLLRLLALGDPEALSSAGRRNRPGLLS